MRFPDHQCQICGSNDCTVRGIYLNTGKQVSCIILKELEDKNFSLETKIILLENKVSLLEKENKDLIAKSLTQNNIIEILNDIEAYLNVSPNYNELCKNLKSILDNKNFSNENRYFIFQQAISRKYKSLIDNQFNNIINVNLTNFIDYLKYNMDDSDENNLIEFIKCYGNNVFYELYLFFKLERPELSKVLEDIMYEIIIYRNTNPNSNVSFTSGTWPVYRIVEEYKDANLGKALYAIKKIASSYAIQSEIDIFLKKYPEAVKYANLL